MISLPTFMSGSNFFQSSLLMDISESSTAIYIPDSDIPFLPDSFPYQLVIGNPGYEEVVLCTGMELQHGVYTGGYAVVRGSRPRARARVAGERIICAPTIDYFNEIHSYISLLVSEYLGLLGANIVSMCTSNGAVDLTDRVLINASTGGADSFLVTGTGNTVTMATGIGICNKRLISSIQSTDLDLTPDSSTISPDDQAKAVLCYIDEFGTFRSLASLTRSNPIVPDVLPNTLPLASFKIAKTIGIFGDITDLRVTS